MSPGNFASTLQVQRIGTRETVNFTVMFAQFFGCVPRAEAVNLNKQKYFSRDKNPKRKIEEIS